MFLELIATFVAGIAGAGVVLLINRLLGGRLPKWLVPIAAGAMMLLTTITSEYGWYANTVEGLPEGFDVAQTIENKALYRPWTYVWPFVERFVAVDTATIRMHSEKPGMKLAETYFFGRWSPVNKVPVMADCVGNRRAALVDAVTFEEGGELSGVEWVTPPGRDPILSSICGDG